MKEHTRILTFLYWTIANLVRKLLNIPVYKLLFWLLKLYISAERYSIKLYNCSAGFGDLRPAPKNMLSILIVIMGGMILTTMCMDVVGRMYLKEIHYLGRKLKTNNPFYLIREAKAR